MILLQRLAPEVAKLTGPKNIKDVMNPLEIRTPNKLEPQLVARTYLKKHYSYAQKLEALKHI